VRRFGYAPISERPPKRKQRKIHVYVLQLSVKREITGWGLSGLWQRMAVRHSRRIESPANNHWGRIHSLSGFFLWFGSIGLQDKLRGEKISWAIVAILLGVGGILVAGAVSSFLGRSWLFRLLLVFFGVGLRRRPPGTQ
jgi:hypothetical protein